MEELQVIQNKIYEIRGTKVMLDFDLAEIYQVETRVLNQAVKRKNTPIPEHFMYQKKRMKMGSLRCAIF